MSKRNYLNKRNRLDRLIGLLSSREHSTTTELSRELSISHRTLMRDLTEISEMGIPVETERGRGGGVRINRRWGMGRLTLNYKEIIDLLLALSTIEKLDSPLFLQDMRSIKDKLTLSFPEDQRSNIKKIRERLYIGKTASETVLATYKKPAATVVKDIYQAFFDLNKVTINYTSEKNETLKRVIEPHYLLLNWPIWYILAWDELRDDVRLFRIDRVRKASLSKETFVIKERERFTDYTKLLRKCLGSVEAISPSGSLSVSEGSQVLV